MAFAVVFVVDSWRDVDVCGDDSNPGRLVLGRLVVVVVPKLT